MRFDSLRNIGTMTSKSPKLKDTIYNKADTYILYVYPLFFSDVFALSLSHIARYTPSFQDENISKITKIYTIH